MTPEEIESKLILNGHHTEITNAFRDIAREKFARLLRHNSEIVRIVVVVEHHTTKSQDEQFVVRAQIVIGGPDLVANAVSGDAYQSLDVLVDKLDRLLSKRHGQRKDKRNHPHAVEIEAALPKIAE